MRGQHDQKIHQERLQVISQAQKVPCGVGGVPRPDDIHGYVAQEE